MNINILGIRKLKWTGMGEFNSDDHYIYYCEQESLRRNGVAIIVNKSPKCSTWMQSQKRLNDLCSSPRQTIQYHGNSGGSQNFIDSSEKKIKLFFFIISRSVVSVFVTPVNCSPPGSSVHGDAPGKNTGVGCIPFSRGSAGPRDQTWVSCIVGRFFIT